MIQSNDIWDPAFLAVPEGEGGSGYFIIAILIISAIHWLSQRLKEKREAEHLDEVSKQARETEEWDEDDDEEWAEGTAPTLPPASDELRRFFETLGGEPAPVAPPPPKVAKRKPPAPPPPKPGSGLTMEEQRALEALRAGKTLGGRKQRRANARARASAADVSLADLLRDSSSVKKAFLLKEILDKPVGSRDDQFPSWM